ncbi:MAG: flagellar hook-associated protein FlgL [Ktedonobacterales bacterium]|nr:flagellar hook-associated protein FlgL [Ktedonobacterales bacterium]
MRITPITLANDIVANLQNSYQTLSNIDHQLSSGKRINQSSDDPAGTAYSVDMQSSLDWNTQYQDSSTSATNWLNSTTSALQQLASVASRARTLAIQGGNDTNTGGDRTSIAAEVTQLFQESVQIGNSAYADTYLFAGSQVQTIPFNSQGGYAGDTVALTHQIGPGYRMQVNANATQIFTGTGNIFAALHALTQHLSSNATLAPTPNAGSETLALTGNYTGGAANYTVQVASLAANGSVASVQYSTNGGATWTGPVAGAGTPPTFNLGSGMTASFSNGFLPPTVGDQFTFAPAGPGLSQNFSVQATKNIGNEAVTMTSSPNLPNNPVIVAKAVQQDGNDNVVGIQISTDGGATFGPTVTAKETQPAAETMSYNATAYAGPTTNYLVRAAAVTAGAATSVTYSTNNGLTWSAPVVGVGGPPSFTLAAGLSVGFTTASAAVGDQFAFTATAGLAGAGIAGTQALAAGTATTFAGSNNIQLTWSQATQNAGQVVADADTHTFTPAVTGLNADVAALDAVIANLAGQQAQFGAKTNAAQANLTQMQSLNAEMRTALSHTLDADIAALTTQLATATMVYQAALGVDAKSIQPTLMDFLH